MIKKIVKLGLLIGLLSIISCEADKEEIINVKLKYQHEYPEANYRYYSAMTNTTSTSSYQYQRLYSEEYI